MKRHIFMIAALFGCAQGADISSDVDILPVVDDLSNVVIDAELLPAVELAMDRWAAATCLPIKLNDHGVRWELMDEIFTDDGRPADGLTLPDYRAPLEVQILAGLSDTNFVVAHEFGHRLGMLHTEEPELMSERRTINRVEKLRWNNISEASLTAICAVQDCGCFNPEPGPVFDPSL